MKILFTVSCLLALLISGCASSPTPPETSSTVEVKRKVVVEEAVEAISGTDKGYYILRQSGNIKDRNKTKSPDEEDTKKPNPEPSVSACPAGQLMATRIISGETGTRISEECVTPFASNRRISKRKRPATITLRNVNGNLKVEKVTRK